MSLITWTKEQFATNVSLHDKEHQTLFDLLNRLHTAVATGNRAITGPALDSLIDFVAKHFASEERNMSKTGYAGYAAHKAEHDKLVETCLDLQKKFRAGQANITAETTAFVKDWLVKHIPNVDKAYGPHLNSKGVA
jgi:hemerythrin